MKALISILGVVILCISLNACGCTNNAMNNSTPGTTTITDIIPSIETNIPDPDVDTQMPMYTSGPDGFDTTIPETQHNEPNK